MIEIHSLPKFELSENQLKWLREVWKQTLNTGKIPEYKSIRISLLEDLDSDFVPFEIDEKLVTNYATQITLLGVLNIEPNSKILSDANNIIHYVKRQLIENHDSIQFQMVTIATGLSLNESYVRIVFTLISNYGSFWSSAGGSSTSERLFGFTQFDVGNSGVFDEYIRFSDIKKNIQAHYERLHKYKETSKPIIKKTLPENVNSQCFIDIARINELKELTQRKFDLSKLITLCNELNSNSNLNNYYSVALLTRAIIDHIPPVFNYSKFKELANNYKSEGNQKSFKSQMIHLDNSLRNIGDTHIHSQIRKTESLPNSIQVDFKNDIDVLLGEIVRVLK